MDEDVFVMDEDVFVHIGLVAGMFILRLW